MTTTAADQTKAKAALERFTVHMRRAGESWQSYGTGLAREGAEAQADSFRRQRAFSGGPFLYAEVTIAPDGQEPESTFIPRETPKPADQTKIPRETPKPADQTKAALEQSCHEADVALAVAAGAYASARNWNGPDSPGAKAAQGKLREAALNFADAARKLAAVRS